MLKITEAVEKVQTTKADREVRDARALKIGQGVRQGDVYLARLEDHTQAFGKGMGAQLVSGTTRGSRHVLEGDFVTFEGQSEQLPEWVDRERCLVALFFRVGAGGARLTHPEHAHVSLPPNTTWGTWQQMDSRSLQRVLD